MEKLGATTTNAVAWAWRVALQVQRDPTKPNGFGETPHTRGLRHGLTSLHHH